MLKSISCEKLIDHTLVFCAGINAVVGADDGHNSIGKSSILMLIDFVFGGSDFPSKCDDVIRNIGHLKVAFEYEFDTKYSFVRDTESPEVVYRVDEQRYVSIKEFNEFLKVKYISSECDISFREAVGGFFRVFQKKNYDDNRPLDIVKKDKWASIRKRILKIFGKYWTILELERENIIEQKKAKDIKGTFGSGAVKKITKTQFKKNEVKLLEVVSEIETIKEALKNNVTDIKSIINERNLTLKKEKDSLVGVRADLRQQLYRIETNLSDGKIRNSKSFQEVVEYFPEINVDKLAKVESFHKGITAIMKGQLEDERKILMDGILIAENNISKIDSELLEIVNSQEDAVYLLERLMELDRLWRELDKQNEYFNRDGEVRAEIEELKGRIQAALEDSIVAIESNLNSATKRYIEIIYPDKPILPKIILGKTDYKFDHGDDRGTGKGYANMIALDLAFLEITCLPCLIHDSLLFKNMDIPAVEHLIGIYSSFQKQIFVSIDEVSKYSEEVKVLIKSATFLKLDHDRLAFVAKWKKRTE